MRLAIAAGIVLFCYSNLKGADPRWIRVQSPNFEIYSTAGEGATRDALKQFEQVRAFFVQLMGRENEKPVPVRLIAFNSLKEYEPYRANEVAIAYYHPGAERDTIVMSHVGADTFPIAIHEYVHLVIQHLGMKLPPWLNEGFAELYSTLRPQGDKILIGDLIQGRMYGLQQEKWTPLSVILAADQNSPYYNEKNRAGSLYNEGWALTHMLVLSREYRPKSNQAFSAIMRGEDSITALTAAYDKPLAAIEKDLQAYLRSDRFLGALVPAKLEKSNQMQAPEPAPMFDVRLMLVDLTNRRGRETETQTQLEKLSAEQPSRPEPYAELGYLYWTKEGSSAAEKQFAKAFELGDRSPRLLWDYGRIAESSDPKNSAAALKELVTQQPTRAEARIELAAALLNAGQPGEALGALLELKSINADLAPRFMGTEAMIRIRLGDRDGARKAAERFATYAKTPEDKERAQQLVDYLTPRLEANARPAPPPSAGVVDAARPTLRRTEPGSPPAIRLAPQLPSVSGSFVEFVCGDVLKIVISTNSGKATLVLKDPDRVVVSGRDGGKVDLSCGPQKPVPLRVEFSPPAAAADADGVVRAIHFEP